MSVPFILGFLYIAALLVPTVWFIYKAYKKNKENIYITNDVSAIRLMKEIETIKSMRWPHK